MLPLVLLVLFLLAASGAHATRRMAQRTELEASFVCYQRYGPQLWNALVAALSPATSNDLDALAGTVCLFNEKLRAHVAPCSAIRRASRNRAAACPSLDPAPALGPLRMCLSAAHSAARGAVLDPVERERAAAANAQQLWTTREEALTYASDAASYSDPSIRAAVERALRARHKSRV